MLEEYMKGETQKKIGILVGLTQGEVSKHLERIKKWGYSLDRD